MTTRTHPNLRTHRASSSVWDRRGWNGSADAADLVRWLLAAGGSALALQGIRQRSVPGAMLAGLGASLTWWAFSSRGDLGAMRLRTVALFDRWRGVDRVEDASADSFPASDAPAWTPTLGAGVRRHARGR